MKPGTHVVVVDEEWEARVSRQPCTAYQIPRAWPDNLVYSIYTSGSTGKPKGVMVEHRNLLSFIMYYLLEYEVTPHDICVLKTSISFDVSVAEYAGTLAGGGCLLLLRPGGELDVQYQLDLVRSHKVHASASSKKAGGREEPGEVLRV